jgi:hypothetical protein
MSIEVSCSCGKSLKAPDAAAGKKGRCPGCGAVLAIPPAPQIAPSAVSSGEAAKRPAVRLASSAPVDPSREMPVAAVNTVEQSSGGLVSGERPGGRSTTPVTTPAARSQRPADFAAPLPREKGSKREYFYLVLCIALLPIAISIFDPPMSFENELVATVREHPELIDKLKEARDEESLYNVLPEHRFAMRSFRMTARCTGCLASCRQADVLPLSLPRFPAPRSSDCSVWESGC